MRGFRIEPGEIEARLASTRVREAVVVAREDAPGEKRLVAYVVGEEGAGAEALRAHLRARAARLHGAGRVRASGGAAADAQRQAGPQSAAGAGGRCLRRRAEYEPPRGETETTLAAIWADVLSVERVGRRDNFFELGGHSLLAVRVISRVRQVLEVEVTLGDLFTRPVLADFARAH